MSKKKFTDAVSVLQEFKNSLEELRDSLGMALQEVELSRLAEQACQGSVVEPLDNLLADTELFLADFENGNYEESEDAFDEDEY